MNQEGDQAPAEEQASSTSSTEEENRGRPKRTDWQAPFLEAFALHGTIVLAARRAQVHRHTVENERKRDPEFAAAYEDALLDARESADAQLRHRGMAGTPVTKTVSKEKTMADGSVVRTSETFDTTYVSTAALIAWLRAHWPEKYRDIRIEQTGKDGGPVQVEIEIERERTPQRLEELLEIAAEIGWVPPGAVLTSSN